MFLRSLTPAERKSVYYDQILRDFSPAGNKSFERLEQLHDEGCCRMLGAFENDRLCGYAYIQHPQGLSAALLDFFAVAEEERSKGIGSRFLSLLTEKERFGPLLLAEAEDPDFSSPEHKETDLRRLAFYEKNGWRDSGLRVKLGPYRCRILSPGVAETVPALRRELQSLYEKVFGPDWVRDNMVIG